MFWDFVFFLLNLITIGVEIFVIISMLTCILVIICMVFSENSRTEQEDDTDDDR